jgi:hypothetical protein
MELLVLMAVLVVEEHLEHLEVVAHLVLQELLA